MVASVIYDCPGIPGAFLVVTMRGSQGIARVFWVVAKVIYG